MDKYNSGPYAIGSMLLVIGIACLIILDTKIPAIVLIIAAAAVFLRAQTAHRTR